LSASSRRPPDRLVVALAGAPGVLATATARATDEIGDPGATVRIEVRSTATGVLLYALDAHNGRSPGTQPMLAVQQDGTAVFCEAPSQLAWASSSAPEPHVFAGIGCPSMHEVAIADGLVLYHSGGALQTTALATGRSLTLLPDVGGRLDPPFAWNGRTALVHGYGCVDDFLGEIASDAAPYRGPSCVVRIVGCGERTAAASSPSRSRVPWAAMVTCNCRSGRSGSTRRSRSAAAAARPSASGCSRRRAALCSATARFRSTWLPPT